MAALVLMATSWPEPVARNPLPICVRLFPTPSGIADVNSVCATPASQSLAINAFAREYHSRTSATDALTDPTPNSSTESASATQDTLSTEPSACPTSTTEPTQPPTAQWAPSSTLNKESACLVLMVVCPALTAIPALHATPTSSSARLILSATKSAVTERDTTKNVTTAIIIMATVALPRAKSKQATLAKVDPPFPLTTASSTIPPKSASQWSAKSGTPPKLS